MSEAEIIVQVVQHAKALGRGMAAGVDDYLASTRRYVARMSRMRARSQETAEFRQRTISEREAAVHAVEQLRARFESWRDDGSGKTDRSNR